MVDKEALYSSLPLPLQQLALNLEGLRIHRRRYGGGYLRCAEIVTRSQWLRGDELRSYQRERLSKFLQSAPCSPFWRDRFASFGVDITADDPFLEVAKLPVLRKTEAKLATQDIQNPLFESQKLIRRHTSGTTGSGLVFSELPETEHQTWATWWRYRLWHGITRERWCGYFGGRSVVPITQASPPFWRSNRFGRQLMFSAHHLSDRTAKDYLKALRDNNIEWLHGYPSLIALVAQYELNLALAPPIKVITVSAESLTDAQRSKITAAFPNAKLAQHYGQAEAVANISQCRHGSLHVDEDFSWVEFEPAPDIPNGYRIIGTNWTNPAFPLIRYDTGDIARLCSAACVCGSDWRIVEQIDGRIEDFIELPNGAKVSTLNQIFTESLNVVEAQINQVRRDEITIWIVKGEKYGSADETRLMFEARKRLGNEIRIGISYTHRLPRTAAGKLRLVVSSIT